MTKKPKHWLTFWTALCLGLTLSACNTVEGAGKDIKTGGAAIEKVAKDAKGGD